MPASSASGRHPLVWRRRARPDAVSEIDLEPRRNPCRQPHDKARNAAFAHQKVGADADDRQRDVFRHRLQEGREIILVGGLEQGLQAEPPARNQVILSISALGVMRPRKPDKAVAELVEQRSCLSSCTAPSCRRVPSAARRPIG